MEIETLRYSHFEGEPREWRLEPFTIGQTTLIVGKNASGKSRTLTLLAGLAGLLSDDRKPDFASGNYFVKFRDNGVSYVYELRVKDARIEHETFSKADRPMLIRGKNGSGKIFAEKAHQMMEFHAPDNQLAAVIRRDNIQHPFFEKLNQWANGVRHFQFGTQLGKDVFAVLIENHKNKYNPKDTNAVIATFRRGIKEFGDSFKNAICEDLRKIDYAIDDIGVVNPTSVVLEGNIAGAVVVLYVKEVVRTSITEQHEMSQGMFRVLSVVIQINYAAFSKSPSCILIDDIGEGLDFERSCALVKMLIEKERGLGVQLIMSTNDRFVMNSVPLEHWAVIQRQGTRCKVFNYFNSKEKFENFKFTGMNNFDFFATDFLNEEHQPK